ncbi:GlxA family transcriptional regulator [Streptomyces sp. SL13]|uniref:GlxA family transcriptional regulator n=1 Tax=Streptantibioticus silvisoli TaxID=2705255 RepID=A0AA90KER3_9ACTN|nr:GlxA family transcriptional regulator [Streptantibioticus silvisoli]MDI5968084.1 GlxA family transcriptional regulator [Streptantibioticus silvisoli]
MTPHRVVLVVFPGFQQLDLTGPHEVFSQAGHTVRTVAADPGPVSASSGLTVLASALPDPGDVETVLVVGGPGVRDAERDERLMAWLVEAAARAGRVASVCTGAFLLARAGLLDGRRAVTHWASCAALAREYPLVTVTPDPVFVADGPVWTSAGVTAGMDMALAMVEEDRGVAEAREIARNLVMFLQRPGGQRQFSTQLAAQRPEREPLRRVQDWIADHLGADLTVPALAARAGMSERHFTRAFRAGTGATPAAYVETARVEAARNLLETTGATVESIARSCGFGAAETLHRRFRHHLGVTPGAYRARFTR